MPADPSGVTTDDQAPVAGGADANGAAAGANGWAAAAPAEAQRVPTHDRSAADAGLPPVGPRQAAAAPSADVPPAPAIDPTWASPGPGESSDVPPAPVLDPSAPVDPSAPAGPPVGPQPGERRGSAPDQPGRSRAGRHASRKASRRERASRRGLRIDQRLWSIDPWSVFKISALFYFCLGLIILVAGTLLYNAGRSVGTIDQFESFVTRIGAYGDCVPTAEVPEGTAFEEDAETCAEGEVLVGGFVLEDGLLFRAAAIGGTILVVAGSIGNVLLTVLVNLLNEVTGGLRHTVIREPVPRQPEGGRRARGGSPPGPGARRRPPDQRPVATPPTGSPGPTTQG